MSFSFSSWSITSSEESQNNYYAFNSSRDQDVLQDPERKNEYSISFDKDEGPDYFHDDRVNGEGKDPAEYLPHEILEYLSNFLKREDLDALSLLNRNWNSIIESVRVHPINIFVSSFHLFNRFNHFFKEVKFENQDSLALKREKALNILVGLRKNNVLEGFQNDFPGDPESNKQLLKMSKLLTETEIAIDYLSAQGLNMESAAAMVDVQNNCQELLKMGGIKEAYSLITKIPRDRVQRPGTLRESLLVNAMAASLENGDLSLAVEILRQIDPENNRAMQQLVDYLIKERDKDLLALVQENNLVGKESLEPFLILLSEELVKANEPLAAQLAELFPKNSKQRDWCFTGISRGCFDRGDINLAVKSVKRIKDKLFRSYELARFVNCQLINHRTDGLLELIDAMPFQTEKNGLIKSIIQGFPGLLGELTDDLQKRRKQPGQLELLEMNFRHLKNKYFYKN